MSSCSWRVALGIFDSTHGCAITAGSVVRRLHQIVLRKLVYAGELLGSNIPFDADSDSEWEIQNHAR